MRIGALFEDIFPFFVAKGAPLFGLVTTIGDRIITPRNIIRIKTVVGIAQCRIITCTIAEKIYPAIVLIADVGVVLANNVILVFGETPLVRWSVLLVLL